jgi:RNA polymerase sigma-70 factor (sigma-E family)
VDSEAEREFREFVDARSLALRRTAYALCGDLHTADDLVQSALTKLVGRWHKIDDPERYVRRIIYNHQVSRWRRRAKIREDSAEEVPDWPGRDEITEVDLRLDLKQALLQLGPRQRAVLVLRFYEDLSESAIAEALNCSVGTVRSQTSRALARLRLIAPELGEAHQPAAPLTTEETRA